MNSQIWQLWEPLNPFLKQNFNNCHYLKYTAQAGHKFLVSQVKFLNFEKKCMYFLYLRVFIWEAVSGAIQSLWWMGSIEKEQDTHHSIACESEKWMQQGSYTRCKLVQITYWLFQTSWEWRKYLVRFQLSKRAAFLPSSQLIHVNSIQSREAFFIHNSQITQWSSPPLVSKQILRFSTWVRGWSETLSSLSCWLSWASFGLSDSCLLA